MKQVLTSLTPLIRHLLVGRYDRVADCAFGLSLECTGDVAAEGEETVCYGSVLKRVS